MTTKKLLMAIVELGGYPDFSNIYEQESFQVIQLRSVRKAIQSLKRESPQIIVAEFNFQSDFRDRTSSLESLLAVVERIPDCRVVVFYEEEYEHQLARLQQQYKLHACLSYPIDVEKLRSAIN